MNASLRELQVMLVDRVMKLSRQLDDVTDPEVSKKILTEMQEINHRVILVGGLLFSKQSKDLEEKVAAVRKANASLDHAMSTLTELNGFLRAVSDLLALADIAIDLAKLL